MSTSTGASEKLAAAVGEAPDNPQGLLDHLLATLVPVRGRGR